MHIETAMVRERYTKWIIYYGCNEREGQGRVGRGGNETERERAGGSQINYCRYFVIVCCFAWWLPSGHGQFRTNRPFANTILRFAVSPLDPFRRGGLYVVLICEIENEIVAERFPARHYLSAISKKAPVLAASGLKISAPLENLARFCGLVCARWSARKRINFWTKARTDCCCVPVYNGARFAFCLFREAILPLFDAINYSCSCVPTRSA